ELIAHSRIPVHERGSGLRIAENEDLLGLEVQPGLLGSGGVIDAAEDRESTPRDCLAEPFCRGQVVERTPRGDHWITVFAVSCCLLVQMDDTSVPLRMSRASGAAASRTDDPSVCVARQNLK